LDTVGGDAPGPEHGHQPEDEPRGWRRWGRALAFALSALVLGAVLAFTLSAAAAEPSGTSSSGDFGSTTQQQAPRSGGHVCPDRGGSQQGGGTEQESLQT
jgi:hypothetical protein